ncbi:hypothetical protein JOM56_002135 [Amanita muscaria]
MEFPAPIGGTALPIDYSPSVLFAVLYAALLPLIIFRLIDKRSRSILLISTSIFSVERIIIYSLRAAQARSDTLRLSSNLINYLQISFAMGFIAIANDVIKFLHCPAVNTTFSCDMYEQAPAARDAPLNARNQQTVEVKDYPRRRFCIRRSHEISLLIFLTVLILSIVANRTFAQLFTDQSNATSVFRLRYVATALGLLFTLRIAVATIWAYLKLPRIRTKAVVILLSVCTLVTITAIYRLSVMYNMTDSPLSVGPHSLNSPGAKACFYVFHILPEWLASLILFSTNLRQLFGTGPFGDLRKVDETEERRKKRLEKEEKKAEKKTEKKAAKKAKALLP